MDIERDAKLSWVAPTKRTDGVNITGELSYAVEFVNYVGTIINYPKIGTPALTANALAINFKAEKFAPGNYTAYVRAIETIDSSTGKMSARSNPFPFTLETIANPNAPTGLSVD